MRPYTLRHLFAAVIAVAVVLPTSTVAGIYFNLGFGIGCGGCGRPRPSCLCPPCFRCHSAPSNCVCPPAAPVIPSTTYVPQTEIRRQAYIEHVPVTTYEEVTQTVYVPRQVTRTVPRTVMTQQTRYRDVAVQSYRPTLTQFAPAAPAVGCNTCGENHLGFAPSAVPGYPSILPASAPAVIPSMPAITVSPYASPALVPEYDDVGWRDVYPRSHRASHRHSRGSIRGASMFRPAPSAAAVWQSRF